MIKERKYLNGLLLSLAFPGLGQIYIGKLIAGLLISFITVVFVFSFYSEFIITNSMHFFTILGLWIIFYISITTHIIFSINKNNNIELKKYNKWYAYLFYYVAFSILVNLIPNNNDVFHLPADSMAPTIKSGEYIFANKAVDFKRGDILVFKFPKNTNIKFVKRLIGLPGETIEIKNKILYINNKPTKATKLEIKNIDKLIRKKFHKNTLELLKVKTGEKEHEILLAKNIPYLKNSNKVKIPEDHYFVLGDNRDFSSDSRVWGFVPKENIVGVAKFIIYSRDDFDRIGLGVY